MFSRFREQSVSFFPFDLLGTDGLIYPKKACYTDLCAHTKGRLLYECDDTLKCTQMIFRVLDFRVVGKLEMCRTMFVLN